MNFRTTVSVFVGGLLAASGAFAAENSWTLAGPEGGPVHALAVHPTNSTIALISTNLGIERSTDSGDTWTVVNNTTLNVVQDIAFDPSSPNRVVATEGLIYLSEDSGQTFAIAQGPETDNNVRRVAFGPNGTLYAILNNAKVYKASSPFSTWTPIVTPWPANSYLTVIEADPTTSSQTIYVAVEGLGIYRSANSGTTWSAPLTTGITSPATIAVNEIAVDPGNSTHLLAATSGGIYRSVNSGTNWTLTDGSPSSSVDFKPGSTNNVIAVRYPGQVISSTDNGATWATQGVNMRSSGVPKVRFTVNPTTRLLYASSQGLAASGALPNTHGMRNTGIGGGVVARVVMADDTNVYVGVDAGFDSLYRRSTSGTGVYQRPGNVSALLQAVTYIQQITGLSVAATNADVIWVVNRWRELVRTTDRGFTWSAPHAQFTTGSATDYITEVKIAPNNPLIGYVARAETGLWKTTDGGATFTQLVNSPPYVSAIGVSPLNPALVYIAGGAMNGSGIYKSTNSGATWTEQLAHADTSQLIYYSFTFHPVDVSTVYAVGWGGVQKTTNAGTSWSLMNFGATIGTSPPASALLIDPMLPSTMVLVNTGSGPGFARSVDGGATWAETLFDIPGTRETTLSGAVMPYPGFIIAGSTGSGILEYTVAPDLSLSMPDIPAVLPLNTTYQLPITITNNGTHASSASQLEIIRPTWLTPVVPANCMSSGQSLTCNFGALQPGQSVVLPLSLAVAGVVNGSQFTVLLTGHEMDSNTANNRIDETVTAEVLHDLDVTLSAAPATIDHDGTTLVTAQYFNRGPSPATNARIDFFLPGLTRESVTPSTGTCAVSDPFCSFGTIAPGASATVTMRFRGDSVGTFPVTAMVLANAPDSDAADNTAQLDLVVRPVSDISVSLAESADPVNVGAPLQYVATVRNNGGDGGVSQLSVAVTGALVSGATTTEWTCTTTASTVSCAVNPLPVGTSSVTITLATATPGIATASATVAYSGTDTQPANNTANIGTTIRLTGDLSVEIAGSVDPVALDTSYTYTATVHNSGPNAGRATIYLSSPAVTLSNLASTGATCQSTVVPYSCVFASLASGATAIVTASASASVPGNPGVTAEAVFAGFDPDTSNNTASIGTTIRVTGDLSVEVIDSVDPVALDTSYTYTATVRNAGPNAGGATIYLGSSAVTLSNLASAGATCQSTAVPYSCVFASLASGATAVVTASASASAPGNVGVTAEAVFAGFDPNASNNTAGASTQARRVADVSVEIADSVDPATTGTPFIYTATIRNDGPNAGAVQLAVPVTGATVSTATATGGGTCTTTTTSAACDFAALASGASATVSITVNAAAAGPASAVATATFSGTDLVAGNNAATASTTVAAPPPPPPPSGSGSSSSSGGGKGGGGGRFDWLALALLGAMIWRKQRTGVAS